MSDRHGLSENRTGSSSAQSQLEYENAQHLS